MARITGILCIALGAAAFAWAAAPALSLEPYVPEPVEFEQELPGFGYLSPVVEAPRRFDAVGIAGELRPYEIRVRERGARWSPWLETEDGSPVWAGGADELQVRIHGVAPDARLHYVNVSGDATPLGGALSALRGAVNAAFVAVASAAPARAEAPAPRIRRRAAWDPGEDCRPRTVPAYGRVKAATVHHTVNANDYEAGAVAGMVRAICLFHRNGNGWNDIGYNAVVDRFGRVWEGRAGGTGRAVVGAHNQGYNSQTTGVALLGTHTSEPITSPAMRAVVRYLAWKLSHHGTQAIGRTSLISGGGSVNRYPAGSEVAVKRVSGHKATNSTACPGEGLGSEMPKIRRRAQRRIAGSTGGAQPEPDPDPEPDPIEVEVVESGRQAPAR